MSSTNRGSARYEHEKDYYVTPIKDIVNFLHWLLVHEPTALNGIILDPCAGGGTNLMSYPEALKRFGINDVMTIDIRQDSLADIKTDYLTYKLDKQPNVIITNPPFVIAEQIIRKALADVKSGGLVIMLLRLNYFGSDKRKPLWDELMPKYAYVHSKRISFLDNGKTDSIEYMHAVWKKGEQTEFTKLKII